MKLVDTSVWVPALRRKGDESVRSRLAQILSNGQAAWCSVVRLELWSGIGGEEERQMLKAFEQRIPELPITDEVWQEACELAGRCRKAGKTAPATDVLVAACARHHGVELEAADNHFDFLMTL